MWTIAETSGSATSGAASAHLLILVTGISIVLVSLYAIQLGTCIQRHKHFRKTVEGYPAFCDEINPGRGTYFLFVAFFLPFGISAISVLASFLRPSGDALADKSVWAAPFWGMANVVFVLMITLMISYLYDRSTPEWTTALTASLVLDILSYLVFVLVFNDPQRWPESTATRWYHMALLGVVGAASFITSFTTIYYTRSFDKFVVNQGDKGIRRVTLPVQPKPAAPLPSNSPNSERAKGN